MKKILLPLFVLAVGSFAQNDQIDENSFFIRPLVKIAVLADASLAPDTVPLDYFNEQLEKRFNDLGYNIQVDNFSSYGDSSLESASRITGLLASEPNIVIVSTGYRDMLNSNGVDFIRRNLDDILEQLVTEKIHIIMIGMKSTWDKDTDYIGDYNNMYLNMPDRYPALSLIDTPLFKLQADKKNYGNSKYFLTKQGLGALIEIVSPEITNKIQLVESTQSMFDFKMMFGYTRPSLDVNTFIINDIWTRE